MSNIIDKIQLSGTVYALSATSSGVSVVEVTQAEYDALPSSAKTDTSKMYVITDAEAGDLTQYWTSAQTQSAITQAVSGKVDTTTFNTYSGSVETALSGKQDTLVSGTNIKTINNTSILGSGNIDIQGGGGKAIEAGRGISVTTGITADTVSFNLPISAGTGSNSIIEGFSTSASGNYSHAEGFSTSASGNYSHAEGLSTSASGNYSHAEGDSTIASYYYTHAEGYKTSATSISSHAEGSYNSTSNSCEHASGRYNITTSASTTWGDSGNTLFSVGNGTSSSARHNAFEIRQNGDIYYFDGTNDVKLQDVLNSKQTTLTAGTGISIIDNVISATGGGGGGGTVDSAITSGSSNAVESKAIWSATTYNKEITLQWDNGFPSKLSVNYPSGCKKFIVTVPSDNSAYITLFNGGSPINGIITISNYGSPTVSIDGLDGTTYTISGNDVTFVIPNAITFDNLNCDIRRITSIKAIVEGAWIADNTYMKEEVDAIQYTLQNNINQKLDSTAYTPVTIDSTLIENSTNPVEGGVLYDELIYKGAASETTIEWSGDYSTNYPSGCTQIKVEVSGSMNYMTIDFIDDNWTRFGSANINNWGSISVYFNDLQGATYEISGTTVTISYPSVTGVTKINSPNATYTIKAVTYGASTTVKDALGGLKLVKLTQTEYDNLQTKDNNTLYVIVN